MLLAVSTTSTGLPIAHIVVTSPAICHQLTKQKKKKKKKNQEEESGLDCIPFNRTLLSLLFPSAKPHSDPASVDTSPDDSIIVCDVL